MISPLFGPAYFWSFFFFSGSFVLLGRIGIAWSCLLVWVHLKRVSALAATLNEATLKVWHVFAQPANENEIFT